MLWLPLSFWLHALSDPQLASDEEAYSKCRFGLSKIANYLTLHRLILLATKTLPILNDKASRLEYR